MNAKSISFIFVIFFSFLLNVLPANGEDSIYEIQGKSISYEDDQNLIFADPFFQVNLDSNVEVKLTNEDGCVAREDFIKFAQVMAHPDSLHITH